MSARGGGSEPFWIDKKLRGFSNAEALQLIGLLEKLKLKMGEARR